MQGVRMTTVFLDLAKAFDKVKYRILINKSAKQTIKDKPGKWIKDLLINSKFSVIANGNMWDEYVLS